MHNNTIAKVRRPIQQAENPTPAVVISVKAARIDNAHLLDYLTSEVALEEPEIGNTDPNIPIDKYCADHELLCGISGSSGDYADEGDASDEHDAIPTASQQQHPATELKTCDLATSDVDGYKGDVGHDADPDANEEEETSQADHGSTQNVED